MFVQLSYGESQEVEVVIPDFTVRVNGETIKTKESQYPIIVYKNITYFPMTSDYLEGIGLTLSWSKETGISINKGDSVVKLEQKFLGASNQLKSRHTASVVSYPIMVNGRRIDNSSEAYPILNYKNITYFPMTWQFAVTEFGWQTKWSNETGLEIIIENGPKEPSSYPITDNISFKGAYVNSTPNLNWEEFLKTIDNLYQNGSDFSKYDFSDYDEIKHEFRFHNDSKFSKELPEFFDPEKVLNWANTPMYGIRELHARGITGKGVNIAYVDQSLGLSHEAIQDKNIHYTWIDYKNAPDLGASMHGIGVSSLILGDQVGAAPDVNLYYYGHPAYFKDQKSHAEAIYQILELNKTLDEKIKVIGFSDNMDEREDNIEAFEEAVRVANESGVLVLFADNGRSRIAPYLDRNNPNNYETLFETDEVCYPVTYTLGNSDSNDHYTYYPEGGTSWTTPVEISLVSLALQVDPDFDVMKFEEYINITAYQIGDMKLVNPVGFIDLVEKMTSNASYYNFIYNSKEVTDEDLGEIKKYAEKFEIVNLIDAYGYTYEEIYTRMKQIDKNMKGELKGIQIFGTDLEVPAFRIHDKVDMGEYGIHDAGDIVTDHFYGNFNNDVNLLNEDMSMYRIFDEKIDIDFSFAWSVARLPIQKGGFKSYFDKYYDFKINDGDLPLVNFSNPIFASNHHSDNYAYFIEKRLDEEFDILDNDDYRLYGNLKGDYPINTDVLGDLTAENLAVENQKGPMNLVINSHGQIDNIDRAYYINDDEKRVSFLNNDTVNETLNDHYYNLFQWTCWGSAFLNDKNINQLMISEGEAINIISASYLASNNGMDVYDGLEDLKSNNGISLFYHFIEGLYGEKSEWSESFRYAKEQYVMNNLSKDALDEDDGNYQFNMNNAIMFNHLGLLDSAEEVKGVLFTHPSEKTEPIQNDSDDEFMIQYNLLYEDNQLDYNEIGVEVLGDVSEIEYAALAEKDGNTYLKVNYNQEEEGVINFFLVGGAPGLSTYSKTLPEGKGILILEVPTDKFNAFEVNVMVCTNGMKGRFHNLKTK